MHEAVTERHSKTYMYNVRTFMLEHSTQFSAVQSPSPKSLIDILYWTVHKFHTKIYVVHMPVLNFVRFFKFDLMNKVMKKKHYTCNQGFSFLEIS